MAIISRYRKRENEVLVDCAAARVVYDQLDRTVRHEIKERLGGTLRRILGLDGRGIVQTASLADFCRRSGVVMDDLIARDGGRDVAPSASDQSFRITTPANGDRVGPFDPVAGILAPAGEGAVVWVLIQPDADFWWVQPEAVASEGTWRATTRFGDPYTRAGHHFQLRALIGPAARLQTGDTLRQVPAATRRSNLVHVYFKG